MKIKLILTIALVASYSFADLGIEWKSTLNYVGNQPGTGLIGDGTYAALIWSATAPTTATVLNTDGTAISGEFLLNSTTDTTGGGFSLAGAAYTSDDVGGSNIYSGYFFTRIFDTTVLSDGNYYSQGGVTGPTLIDAGSPPSAGSTYSDFVYSSSAGFGQTVNGYTVVPEPATIGLFGLGALSAWIVRRNKLKAREEV